MVGAHGEPVSRERGLRRQCLPGCLNRPRWLSAADMTWFQFAGEISGVPTCGASRSRGDRLAAAAAAVIVRGRDFVVP
jgi:hypothetical protein